MTVVRQKVLRCVAMWTDPPVLVVVIDALIFFGLLFPQFEELEINAGYSEAEAIAAKKAREAKADG